MRNLPYETVLEQETIVTIYPTYVIWLALFPRFVKVTATLWASRLKLDSLAAYLFQVSFSCLLIDEE